jgi:drug/metabolite transporter (DMT)-like permease
MNRGALYGLASAALFGVSTPLAKLLVNSTAPLWLAALLYLGAGTGLSIVMVARWIGGGRAAFALPSRRDWPWIASAILLGGMLGPVALTHGLLQTGAAAASLLLNLEAVVTALLAWFVFRENVDRRIALGMAMIVVGASLLAIAPDAGSTSRLGPALIAIACLCWALDNNLTRKASASDATFLAALKGTVAGSVNAALALALDMPLPTPGSTAAAMALGFLGYGVSLVLFILALRHVGTARAGAYFSVAPFFGAALAVTIGQDPPTWTLASAAVLMGVGVWLHASERHAHEHRHERLVHAHSHRHDEHHRHVHAFAWDGEEPHVHEHEHGPLVHSHPHYPDVHHRHEHH